MAERGVAVLAAAATAVGAATVVNAAVIGIIQLLFLQHLEEDMDDWGNRTIAEDKRQAKSG